MLRGQARSWIVAVLLALVIVGVVWFVLAIPGCGSGASELGLG